MISRMVPLKKITKYKRMFVVLLIIVFMYCSLMTYSDSSDTQYVKKDLPASSATNESELLRLAEVRAEPRNVIPNLHSILQIDTTYKTSSHANKSCMFPANANSPGRYINYIANVSHSDWQTTEETVFKNLTEKVQELTRATNEKLQQILNVEKLDAISHDRGNLYSRKKPVEPTVKHDKMKPAIDFGSHLYFPGGHWIPRNCKPKWKVAVIVPYRDRESHLHIFLRNLVPFLLNQELEFGIFIAEQGFSEVMNRGLMKNIGYQMAKLSGTKWDCHIFHDVDYVPINSTNYYGCDDFPKHYATMLEEFKYGNPYLKDFGGVVGITDDQMRQTNGYSNMYWGWGAEDSDFGRRVKFKKLNISRTEEVGYYLDIPHEKKTHKEKCFHRYCLLAHALYRMRTDGLSQIRYERSANISITTLYTKISVDVDKTIWNHNFKKCHVYKRIKHDSFVAVMCVMCYAGVMVLIFICAICGLVMKIDDLPPDVEESHVKQRKRTKFRPYHEQDEVKRSAIQYKHV